MAVVRRVLAAALAVVVAVLVVPARRSDRRRRAARWSAWRRPDAPVPAVVRAQRRRAGAVAVGLALAAGAVVLALDARGGPGDEAAPSGPGGPVPTTAAPSTSEVFENRSETRFSDLPAYRGVAFADDLQAEQVAFTAGLLAGPAGGPASPDFDGRYTNVEDGARATLAPSCDCPEVEVWVVGGSAAFGLGQRDEHTIASELVRQAEERGIRLDVTNLGVPGRTLWQEAKAVEELLADEDVDPPDLIISYGGYNDALGALVESIVGDLDPEGRNVLDADQIQELAEDDFELPADLDLDAVARIAADRYRRAMAELDAAAADRGVRTAYVFHPDALASPGQFAAVRDVYRGLPPWASEPAGAVLEGTSAALAGEVIDLRHLYDDVPGSVFVDWAHTNEQGAALAAAALYDELAGELDALAR